MKIRIDHAGAEEAAVFVRAVLDRATGRQPLTPIMEGLSQQWSAISQDRITNQELELPEMHWLTRKIRKHYGHEGKQRLVRGGDLLHSITPRAVTPTSFRVGTDHHAAAPLQFGGEVEGRDGSTHTVPPHPFLLVTDPMVDEAQTLIADFIVGGAGA